VIAGEAIETLAVHYPSAKEDARGPFKARLIYKDPLHDLAFLSVDQAPQPLEIAADDAFRRGKEIVAIGNPSSGGLVLQNAVSKGVLSTEIEISGNRYYQMSIAINPGNSGGPVFDMSGHVIGVATLKDTGKEGMAFCIPAAQVAAALDVASGLSESEIAR